MVAVHRPMNDLESMSRLILLGLVYRPERDMPSDSSFTTSSLVFFQLSLGLPLPLVGLVESRTAASLS